MKHFKFYNTRMACLAIQHMHKYMMWKIMHYIDELYPEPLSFNKLLCYTKLRKIYRLNMAVAIICMPYTIIKNLVCDVFEIGYTYRSIRNEEITEDELFDFIKSITIVEA